MKNGTPHTFIIKIFIYALLKILKLFDNIVCMGLRFAINFLMFKLYQKLI